jgi:hypothetical protein
LRDPESSIEKMVSKVNQKEDELKTNRESDQLIVLRERESRSQGEGVDSDTKLAKETLSIQQGWRK